MREGKLRPVLLVKAIEETDGTELLIPDADRKAATREARRDAGDEAAADELNDASALPGRAQRMLAARAEVLLAPVVSRHPFVETVSNLASGPRGLGWALVALSALCGVALSALDGPRRIDIVSLPLLGLVAWNLIVYGFVIAGWFRSSKRPARQPRLAGFFTARILGNLKRYVDRSAKFDVALAEALNRFAREWSEVAKPLLVARASRVFHLCAAAAGAGLIAGLYLRGITLDYTAGWESTFIDAHGVHMLSSIIYGPASAVTGIPIPNVAHLEAIRWQNGAGGERAANWIHLLTATVAIFIVLPRLVLVLLGTFAVWRRSLRTALPPTLTAYFRKTFGGEGVLVRTAITVMPYAYEPSGDALIELRRQLTAALGENGVIDLRPPVRYGDEETLLRSAGDSRSVDVLVVLMNLAATPEDENHGAVIAGVRQRFTPARASGKALVILDERPYAERMGSLGGPVERMSERRRLWQSFVEKHGLKAYFATLVPPAADLPAAPQEPDVERLRSALLQSA
ncbi:MAG TPA: DUF2868 domain-containing protein [Burkholderiales bacterium]|nr:DUF2868 domain-containing protein [Burkholderiales bacterium]